MAKITNIDELKIAVEDAAEAKIFENVWMASEEVAQEAFAKGLSVIVLIGDQIVEIEPDGKTKKVLKTLDLKHAQVEKRFESKRFTSERYTGILKSPVKLNSKTKRKQNQATHQKEKQKKELVLKPTKDVD